jgi:uncharacterized membrane protein YkoI
MLTTPSRRTAMAVAALGALGLGGSAIAGAADSNGSSSSNGTSSATTHSPDHGRGQRRPLSTDAAAKVKAAALAKVPGATVLETEAGGPYSAPYHAHIRTSDGTREVVLVDASFQATAVQADDGRAGGQPGGHGGRDDHGAETPLTGDTKSKVEAAVLARYPGATIERTETNTDGSAPYESHIRTSAGTQLEVHVAKDLAVVDAQQPPAHP